MTAQKQESSVFQIHDSEVIEVAKDYFFDGIQLPVNVYLKLNPGRYLVIGKVGERSNFSTLHSFTNPMSIIYVSKSEHSTLVRYISALTEQMISHKELPSKTKVRFIQSLTDDVLALLDDKNLSDLSQLHRVSKIIVSFAQSVSNFEEINNILSDLPNDDSKHSMTTCMVALLISEEMGITMQNVLEKISFGSLLHDIGLKYVPQDILKKPKHEWSFEENQIYESHPMKAVEMLRDMKDITNDILLMIAEHHENAIGTGFPRKFRDVKISPLGRILIVADYFSDLIFGRIDSSKTYDAPQAVEYIEDVLGQPFNKQVFRALKMIVNKHDFKQKLKAAS